MDLLLLRRARVVGCPYDHARYIRNGMRAGQLEENRVALCAYLYHRPCEIVMVDYIKNNGKGFLWFDHMLKRHEPLPLIKDLKRWGNRIVFMAACGVIKKNHYNVPFITSNYFVKSYQLVEAIYEYVTEDDDAHQAVKLAQLRKWPIHQQNGRNVLTPYQRRSQDIKEEILYDIWLSLSRFEWLLGTSVLTRANSFLPDDILLDTMRSTVVPWALREYA